MRILFFCTDPRKYDPHSKSFQIGGGWVTSVIKGLLQRCPDWIIGIGCEGTGIWGEMVSSFYRYPIDTFYYKSNKLKRKLFPECEGLLLLPKMLKCIEDFRPDVIMVFGTECPYGIVAKHTNIPVIIHLQGLLTAIQNALFPPGISKVTLSAEAFPNIRSMYKNWNFFRIFNARAKREIEILKNCHYYFGRTGWDYAVLRQYNPVAEYTECWELLREDFYLNAGKWIPHKDKKIHVVSTISSPLYKGADLILKTARLLKERNLDFSWDVIGIDGSSFFEKNTEIKASEVNVYYCGRTQDVGVLINKILKSDVYVHPSYIENSPNSLCEAQILGIPVIAVAVGGVPTLVEHGKTGFLVPANDPYMLAEDIVQLKTNETLQTLISETTGTRVLKRHDQEKIFNVIIKKLHYLKSEKLGKEL